MPFKLDVSGLRLCVDAEPLTAAAFAPFGDVIENPRPDVQPSEFAKAYGSSSSSGKHPYDPVSANQGSAIKYQHVSRPADLYATNKAPSGRPSVPVTNVFVCAARELLKPEAKAKEGAGGPASAGGLFAVTILERHPYTTQTFVPLTDRPGRASAGSHYYRAPPSAYSAVIADTRYLVIVAPSQPDGHRLPDIPGLRAFIARGDQAVTYGAGTWHAPMAALGAPGTSLAYAVFQFANGVGPEDCEEVVLESGSSDPVAVLVPPPAVPDTKLWSKL